MGKEPSRNVLSKGGRPKILYSYTPFLSGELQGENLTFSLYA